MIKMAAHSHAVSFSMHPHNMTSSPPLEAAPHYAIHAPPGFHDASDLPQPTADASGIFTVDADVDV